MSKLLGKNDSGGLDCAWNQRFTKPWLWETLAENEDEKELEAMLLLLERYKLTIALLLPLAFPSTCGYVRGRLPRSA